MKTFTYEDQDRIWENLSNQQYICTMNYIKAIFKKENE